VCMADLWSRVVMRLADAPVLPLRYSDTAQFAIDQLQALADRAEDAGAGKPDSLKLAASVAPALAAAQRLLAASQKAEGVADAALARGSVSGDPGGYNAAVLRAERLLLGPGLPGRTWFRHELYAPGLNTGYAAVPLPRLGQAVLDADPRAWSAGVKPVAEALDRAASELARVR